MSRTLINLADKGTRLEMNAKPYAIFKYGNEWGFAKFKETNESDLEVDGEIQNFDQLQKAFDYADKKNLMFL